MQTESRRDSNLVNFNKVGIIIIIMVRQEIHGIEAVYSHNFREAHLIVFYSKLDKEIKVTQHDQNLRKRERERERECVCFHPRKDTESKTKLKLYWEEEKETF